MMVLLSTLRTYGYKQGVTRKLSSASPEDLLVDFNDATRVSTPCEFRVVVAVCSCFSFSLLQWLPHLM